MDYGEYFRTFTGVNANRLNETYQMVLNEIKSCTGKKPKLIMAPREFTEITGCVEAAIILSQLLYWHDKTKNPQGWIYKSYKDWEEETGLKKSKVIKARKILEDGLEIVESTRSMVGGAPTLHYRVKVDMLVDLINIFYADTA